LSARTFYVTTPIYYINDAPHVGHAYTSVACDVIARYKRMRGFDVRYLTGTDEHGQKALKTATALGESPRALADRMVVRYREAWKVLGISHDDFIRTTEDRHVQGAQELWRRMLATGDLYRGSYEGRYCVGCESYYPESQLVDGKCPTHEQPLDLVKEETWFFRLSKYQKPLLDLFEVRPDFVQPPTRMNEVRSFVEMGLEDLSISRTIPWGVPVPDDPEHVMYVWLDALSNYVTALGFGPGSPNGFSPYWPADLHVLGKDILRFHAVFWPAFLMSAGLEPPKRILCHGWWLKDQQKMSKTTGNVADPMKLVAWFGADAVRYFLMREIRLGADGNYSEEALLERVNTDLANDLGNTLSRVTKIVSANLAGVVPRNLRHGDVLSSVATTSWVAWLKAMDAYDPQEALRAAWDLLSATNKFLVAEEPWKLAKDTSDHSHLAAVMHDCAEALRHVAVMVAPVMPTAAREIWRRLGAEGDPFARPLCDEEGHLEWGFTGGMEVVHESGLFPRMDKASFFASAEAAQAAEVQGDAPPAAAAAPAPAAPAKPEIAYDDFAKIALMAARVVKAEKHPQADKLLVLTLDDGSGTPRTICAGIAAWYAPEQLAGKTVGIVANLAPRKLRGIMSQGMMLAASHHDASGKEQVQVVILPDHVPPGSEIR
jgi:methionyl-tRNA synthetase